ncbi:unnamed protein product [Periconia digitata]|uniref:Uncharacterized protein n=1 Tax=Periconia digitata TaxID=1303443 RepID=A0A9W4UQH2_9PLEO|nr:unnamed protein product [Periconia digitata]
MFPCNPASENTHDYSHHVLPSPRHVVKQRVGEKTRRKRNKDDSLYEYPKTRNLEKPGRCTTARLLFPFFPRQRLGSWWCIHNTGWIHTHTHILSSVSSPIGRYTTQSHTRITLSSTFHLSPSPSPCSVLHLVSILLGPTCRGQFLSSFAIH